MSRAGPHHAKIVQIMGQLNPLRPRNQVMVVGGMLAMGAPSGFYTGTTVETLKMVKRGASVYRKTVGPITRIASAYSSVESAMLLRKGGYKPAFSTNYVPMDPHWLPPLPHIGPIPIVQRRLELGAEKIQSRGGEHTASSGTPRASIRKSMRDPSAKRKAYLVGTEGTRFAGKAISGHKLGTRGPCDKGYVFKKIGRKYMCVPR